MATEFLKLSSYLYPINRNVSIFPRQSSINYSPKYNNKHIINCSIKAQNSQSTYERRSANYQPTSWNYNFLQSLKNKSADELYKDNARKLEEDVRSLINNESEEMLKKLELIDDIQRLGLAYIFEEEIKKALHRFVAYGGFSLCSNSLHATALLFRLLRQHGYHVSQDVFKGFMDHKGDILESFKNDVKGILSMYEASFLSMEGEYLLDKAKTHAIIHLDDLQRNSKIEDEIVESVSHAVELSLCRKMVMLEARWHIEAYSKRKDANPSLLELAKLNFNMMQSVLQGDLKDMSRWWTNLGLANKLSFCRDRLVESFFWTVGMMFEPQFSSCRKMLTKVVKFITIVDDVYDVYGTLDELELFTQAVERWDVHVVKDMPDYMKLCYLSLYNTTNEMAYDILKQQGEEVLPYLTKAWADLCKSFLQEAKWGQNQSIPSFDEYIENGWLSSSGSILLIHSYFFLDPTYSKQAIDSLINYHEVLRCSSLIFRLCNDLATSSDEISRGKTANSVSCYMNEKGVTEEARKHINELIDKAWKKLNQYKMGGSPFAKSFIETAINLVRIAQCTYQHGDGYGHPDGTSKKRVLSLIIEPVSLRHTQTNVHPIIN